MKVFNKHEVNVLSNAMSRIHLIYSSQSNPCKGDVIVSKAIKVVFKTKYPAIQADENITVTFRNLMSFINEETRVELASWYINEEDVSPPSSHAEQCVISKFAAHLTILSDILKIPPPDTRKIQESGTRERLSSFWDKIHDSFVIYR